MPKTIVLLNFVEVAIFLLIQLFPSPPAKPCPLKNFWKLIQRYFSHWPPNLFFILCSAENFLGPVRVVKMHTKSSRPLDEIKHGRVDVGVCKASIRQLRVEGHQQFAHARVELGHPLVHTLQALSILWLHSLRWGASQWAQPMEYHLPSTKLVKPLHIPNFPSPVRCIWMG